MKKDNLSVAITEKQYKRYEDYIEALFTIDITDSGLVEIMCEDMSMFKKDAIPLLELALNTLEINDFDFDDVDVETLPLKNVIGSKSVENVVSFIFCAAVYDHKQVLYNDYIKKFEGLHIEDIKADLIADLKEELVYFNNL